MGADRHCLIVSKRIRHLVLMRLALIEEGWMEDKVHMLTGSESIDERRQVIKEIKAGSSSVTLSTIAQEAIDVPKWSLLAMAFPIRKPEVVEQLMGRIERVAPGKPEPLVLDFGDPMRMTSNQQVDRFTVYRNSGAIL